MSTPILAPPDDADWPAILELANAALPWDTSGNQEWLANRRGFSGQRRHYLARETPSGPPLAYGAIEEGPEPGLYRVFIVMAPARLHSPIATHLYEQLAADLAALHARGAWVREYARDTPILDFFGELGFVAANRFTLPDHEEMVVLVHPFP
jgi:hypothetical protein